MPRALDEPSGREGELLVALGRHGANDRRADLGYHRLFGEPTRGVDGFYFVMQSNSIASYLFMKSNCFKRVGWFYFPVSIFGGIVWLGALLFCLTVFRAVDRHSHSVADTLYGIFPFFVCTFLLVDWIGARSSGKESPNVQV